MAHEKDEKEDNSDADKIHDNKSKVMVSKDTKGSPGIIDTDNPENTCIEKGLPNLEISPYPYLGELVGNNYKQNDTAEDHIPPLISGAV
jgi:hypothetical protein